MITLYHTPSKYLNLAFFFRIQVYGVTKNRHNSSCATVSLAELASANIVGYNNVTLKKGYNMMAVNFGNVSSGAGIALQDLIPGTGEGLTGAQSMVTADQIQVWDSTDGVYTYYYLYKTSLTIPALAAKNGKWVTQAGVVTDVTFKNGDVFWFKKQGEGDIDVTVSGAVSVLDKEAIEIKAGYNMIANPFPTAFNPNSLGTDFWSTSGAVGAQAMTTADQLQVYDSSAEAYNYYYLYYTSLSVPALKAKNWKWVTQAGAVVEDTAVVIPVGKGAWYKHQGEGFTFNISNPTK